LDLFEQSANFQGSTQPNKEFFLKTVSFANLAASLALADKLTFSNTCAKTSSFSTKKFLR
jgi:hypothetical protein